MDQEKNIFCQNNRNSNNGMNDTVFNFAPVAMMIIDKNGFVCNANKSALEMVNKDKVKMENKTVGDVLGCVILQENNATCGLSSKCSDCTLMNVIKNTLSTKTAFEKQECYLPQKVGENIQNVNYYVSSAFIEIDGYEFLLLSLDNITKLKEAEEQLRKHACRMQNIFEYSPYGIMYLDGENNVLDCNSEMLSTLKYNKQDIMKKHLNDFIIKEDIDNKIDILETLKSHTNENIVLQKRFICGNKDIKILKVSFSCIYNEIGDIERVIAIFQDITIQKANEEARIIAEERLRTVFGNVLVSIVLINAETKRIADINPAALRLLNLKRHEAIGKKYDLIINEKEPNIDSFIYNSDNMTNYETVLLRTDNKEIPIIKYSVELQMNNGNYILESYIDISRRKAMESEMFKAKQIAEEATLAKSNFLARMSHEIRTPLNAIMGIALLAINSNSSALINDYLSKIKTASDSLLLIINDILDYSKIESGKMKLENIEFELSDVFTEVSNVVSLFASQKGLELIFDYGENIPQFVKSDPHRLRQIILNLVNNAIKFTNKGEIIVRVRLQSTEEEKVTLLFTVQDTGIGISEKQKDLLFDSFSQADESTTRKFGGTGLGLAICKYLVELMNGKISVESILNKGSIFSFTIEFGAVHKQPQINSRIGDNIKVLVVDDNMSSRQIISSMISTFMFKVTTASSGSEAIRMIEAAEAARNSYDIVLMDWKMPEIDGLEASKIIKTTSRLQKTPSILMITAYEKNEIENDPRRKYVNGILTKPINKSDLYNITMGSLGNYSFKTKKIKAFNFNDYNFDKIAGAKVLLVEDSKLNQFVATELLKKMGMIVEIAENGVEAIIAVADNDYDIVFMDVHMPEMDGDEATRKIRTIKNLKNLPIIAMTANAMQNEIEKNFEAGMNGHISKPIDPILLVETLFEWIKPMDRHYIIETQEPEQEEVLPTFKSIDTHRGLVNVAGNTTLYKKVILDFPKEFDSAENKIKKYLETEDFKQAEFLSHTIKGVAGNIAANALYKAASELEQVLKNKKFEMLDVSFNTFKAEIKEVLREIILNDNQLHNKVIKKSETQIEITELIKKLRPLLESSDSEAISFLLDISNSNIKDEILKQQLSDQISDMDFDEALTTLNQIEK
jgi:two-component system sensor histidine kinase/response regulator